MAMPQRGRGSGVTGVIDLAGYSAKFVCKVYRYSVRAEGATRPRRGRGGGAFAGARWIMSGGSIVVTGKIEYGDGWPTPDAFKGQTGTLTIQVAAGKTIAYPIIVTGHDLSHDEFNVDKQFLALTCQLTGEPTYSGWTGTQPAATDPTRSDQQQWSGSSLTYDPKNLQDSAVVTIDWWDSGVADTTAAERTKLIDVLTAATAPTGLKKRPGTIVRDATDGGTITLTYGLTDTEDDVEMPGTTRVVDESSLQSSASVTVVETDSTPDGGVSVSGLVLRSTTRRQLHDGKWAITYNFSETTTEDDVEFAGTITNDDPGNLIDSATVRIVNSSSAYPVALDTAPTGLKLRNVVSLQLTNGDKWSHTGEYGRRSTEDDVEQGGTSFSVDQSGNIVSGSARVTVVESDSTPDGGVSVSGLVLREVEKKQIHDSKWEITYIFGQNTPEDDIEFENTVYENDPGNLTDSAKVALVTNSGTYPVELDTPPTTPATATLKLRRVVSRKLTTPGIWLHIGVYAMRTEEDEVEQKGTDYQIDQSGNVVAGSARVTVVENDATPDGGVTVSGLVLRFVEKQQLNDGKWAITYVFGQNTPETDIEFDGTVYENDVSNLNDSARVALVNGGSAYPVALDTPPATPATATLKLQKIVSRQLTTSGQWLHVGHYGLRTEEDRIEQVGTEYQFDQSGNVVAGSAKVTVVESDATPDGGVTVSGLVLRFVEKQQLNDGKWAITYVFGQNTPETDIEFDATVYVNDVSNLEDSARVALVNNSGTYPVALDTPPTTPTTGTLKLRQVITRQLTTSGQWLHIGVYALNTEEDEIELPGSPAEGDSLGSRIVTTELVSTTDSAETYLNANIAAARAASANFEDYRVVKRTPDKAIVRTTNIVATRIVRLNVDTQLITRPGRGSTVNVTDYSRLDSTNYEGFVSPVVLEAQVGEIVIERRVLATTYANSISGLPVFGRVNNGSFLGFAADLVQYAGIETVYSYTLEGGSRVFVNRHRFRVNSWGFVDQSQVGNGWHRTTTALSAKGYQNASIFGWTVLAPTQADFSVFLA